MFFFTNDKKWIKCQSSGISRVRIKAALIEKQRQRIEYEERVKWGFHENVSKMILNANMIQPAHRQQHSPLLYSRRFPPVEIKPFNSYYEGSMHLILVSCRLKQEIKNSIFFTIRRYRNDDARFRRIWWLSGDRVHFDTLVQLGFGLYLPHEL